MSKVAENIKKGETYAIHPSVELDNVKQEPHATAFYSASEFKNLLHFYFTDCGVRNNPYIPHSIYKTVPAFSLQQII